MRPPSNLPSTGPRPRTPRPPALPGPLRGRGRRRPSTVRAADRWSVPSLAVNEDAPVPFLKEGDLLPPHQRVPRHPVQEHERPPGTVALVVEGAPSPVDYWHRIPPAWRPAVVTLSGSWSTVSDGGRVPFKGFSVQGSLWRVRPPAGL